MDEQQNDVPVLPWRSKSKNVNYYKRAIAWAILPSFLVIFEMVSFVAIQVFGSGPDSVGNFFATILFWLFAFPPCWLIHIFAIICLFVSAHYYKLANATKIANNNASVNLANSDQNSLRGFVLFLIGVLIVLPFIIIIYGLLRYFGSI